MKKLKLFMAAFALLLGWSNAMAQKDITSTYITNAKLNESFNVGWTTTNFNGDHVQGNNTEGYAVESYAGWGSVERPSYSMTQNITLPAGHYRLVNYSFYRYGQLYNTDNTKSYAYLKAGDKKVLIKTLGSITAAGYANTQAEGANVFDSKMYRNVIEFEIAEDNTTINIGVEGTHEESKSWFICGMFELFDLDDAASVSSPTDVTYAITNPGFEYRNLEGWTTTKSSDDKAFWYMDNTALSGKAGIGWVESYQGGGIPNGRSIYQTLTGLDNGLYEVTVYGHLQQGSGSDGFYLYANSDRVAIGSTDQDYSVTTNVTDGNLTIKLATDGCNGNWAAFDKVRMKFYGDPLPAYQELLDGKVATAQALVDGNTIPNAAETALQTVINDNDNDPATFTTIEEFTTAISNIETAYNTYKALETPYAAWQTVKDLADDLAGLTYAETVSGSHTTFTDAISAQNTAAEASTTAEALNTASTTLKTAIKTYMSGATLTFVSELDFTCMIENPSFETGDFTGWTNTGMTLQDNATFTKNGKYYAEKWQPDGTFGVKQTINLPAGAYSISAHAKARAVESAKVYAGSEEADVTIADSEKDYDVKFVSTGSNVEIGFTGTGDGTEASWLCVDNFTMTYLGYAATSEEKAALATAITAAEAKTLGFETSEYAPYNNVDALTKLATAKAIDTETVSGAAVVAATTALNNATWTANDGNVECVYNGNFAEGQGSPAANIQQYGWTRTNGWGQFKNDGFESSTAYYNQPGSLQYGNAGVYTMPLKAQTIYRLQFKYAKWDGNFAPTVSVLNEGSGMAAQTFENASSNYKDGYNSVDMVFVTAAAGNYVLSLSASSNYVITGVSITKAASQVLEFADNSAVPTYAPGTYPSVKITRTLTADSWATGVYPFAISGVDGLTTVNMSAFEGDVLTFSEGATVANQPFLMKASSTKSEISLTNVAVAATSGEANQTISNITMKGVYSTGTVPVSEEESTYRYIVDSSNNTLRKVVDGGTGVTINPYRAYFELSGIDVNNARSNIRMNFGGITGVENIEAAPVATVKKNGAYLENGKIAIYKNGEKFSATGAKLK